MTNQQKILWRPDNAFIEKSNLKAYEKWLGERKGLKFDDYDALWQWSVDHVEDFWESLWQYFEIIHHTPYQVVLSSPEMPGAKWFEGATVNYAEHIFRHRNDEHPALIFQNEQSQKVISWDTLEQQVKAVRQFLTKQGIQKGDRVAAYLPNIPEAIVCFLAVNSMGAVWSCCSPDFGVETVIERFSQIQPRLLIAADGYQYNGKPFDRLSNVERITGRTEKY